MLQVEGGAESERKQTQVDRNCPAGWFRERIDTRVEALDLSLKNHQIQVQSQLLCRAQRAQ